MRSPDLEERKLTQAEVGAGGGEYPSVRALSGRLKFTVRRHKLNKGSRSSHHDLKDWLYNPGDLTRDLLIWGRGG